MGCGCPRTWPTSSCRGVIVTTDTAAPNVYAPACCWAPPEDKEHCGELPIALVNLKDGLENGLALHLLSTIMAPCQTTRPAIIAINEARWRLDPRAP